MSCENCKTGFKWSGKATGTETTLNKAKAYVTGQEFSDCAILIITDIFGWTLPNIRLLADQYAAETESKVYVPDFFDGEVIDPDTLHDPEKAKKFDLPAFIARHSKEIRYPEIKAAAQTLKSQYKKVVAIGFCYGGWACFRLAADPTLVDAIATAHPSMLTKSELEGAKVPVQILAAEHDFAFTEELKRHALEVLPTLGIAWEYVFFLGLSHGFAARGDPSKPEQKHGLERAKRSFVRFANEYLH